MDGTFALDDDAQEKFDTVGIEIVPSDAHATRQILSTCSFDEGILLCIPEYKLLIHS
jgi:hypothetical protein